jgi:hypothetical protein
MDLSIYHVILTFTINVIALPIIGTQFGQPLVKQVRFLHQTLTPSLFSITFSAAFHYSFETTVNG